MRTRKSYILKLIEQGENICLDFKFEISDSRKIAKTISAFSNTDGGTLLIGVKDNGVIAGIRTDEELYMVEAAANMYCKPIINIKARNWIESGKNVLEIKIPKLKDEICYAMNEHGKWIAYTRVNDNNFVAGSVMLKVWKRRLKNIATHINYKENEKFLLQYLADNHRVSMSAFCRKAGINRKKAETIMVNFIMLEIIEWFFNGDQLFYRLKEENKL